MAVKAKYSAEIHSLIEQPEDLAQAIADVMVVGKTSCRTIKCSPDFKGEEEKEYEEGVDYKVYETKEVLRRHQTNHVGWMAFPIPQPEDDQDEWWKEAHRIFNQMYFTDALIILKSKFSITKNKGE